MEFTEPEAGGVIAEEGDAGEFVELCCALVAAFCREAMIGEALGMIMLWGLGPMREESEGYLDELMR